MKKIFHSAKSAKLMTAALSMLFVMVAGVSAAPFILQDAQTVEPQNKPVINGAASQFSGMEKIVLKMGEQPVFSGENLSMPLKPVEAQTSKVDSMQDVLARINADKKMPMPPFKRLEAEKAKMGSQ